uniref:sensor histidine kinase n=1 Tax=Flavobacterium sp. TaxID=239 RepID=UPI004049F684
MRKQNPNIIIFKDSKYILLFYFLMTLFNRISVWFGWGGFKTYNQGYNDLFDLTEFFASTGFDIILKLILSIPLLFYFINKVHSKKISLQILVYTLYGLIFIIISVELATFLKQYIFGWVDFFGDKSRVWIYYHATFFYLLQLGLVLLLVYTRKFKIAVTEKFELNQALLQNELASLKSQLNPHFIHNTFNSINAAIEPENENARELIIALSDLFRYQNEAFQKDFVTIEEEINFIKKYLSILKVRFKERLNIQYYIDENIVHEKIPAMLLQPIVENAIQHGIAPKTEESSIIISIKKVNDKIEFCIEDSGIGMKDKSKIFEKGLGLKNTQLRLQKIYQSQLIIEDKHPSGVKVSFTI